MGGAASRRPLGVLGPELRAKVRGLLEVEGDELIWGSVSVEQAGEPLVEVRPTELRRRPVDGVAQERARERVRPGRLREDA